jgi:hypothetical protein
MKSHKRDKSSLRSKRGSLFQDFTLRTLAGMKHKVSLVFELLKLTMPHSSGRLAAVESELRR